MEKITSSQNPKIKQVLSLRKKSKRDETNLFLIEGYRELLSAVDNGFSIQTLFVCPSFFLKDNEPKLINKIAQIAQVLELPEHLFEKISYRDRPDGLIAIALQKHLQLSDLKQYTEKDFFCVVAESIEKPGNLGTILRSCDAAGASFLIVCDKCTDIFNPNVVRASVGTLFTVPVVDTTKSELFTFLKKEKIKICAATPHTENLFTKTDLTGKVALCMGTEQYGLSDEFMKKSDILVKIPMMGKADSLNVASATTLMLYEALRQRQS